MHDPEREFIGKLKSELDNGFGFAILTGAGLSANAGVPVITQLSHYLQRCIALALGVDIDSRTTLRERRRRWHPRTDAWPPLTDPFRPLETNWFSRIYEEWRTRLESHAWDAELRVFQEALGALAEWRSSLLFLSRLDNEELKVDQQEILLLTDPRQEVIDAFFLHVTSGRAPSLAHRMLAHLSTVLRTTLILTSNFDELIEQAFLEAGKLLKVFDVQLNGGLPHLLALQGSNALIKLHGGRFSLRGDYSLDAEPTEHDRKRFVEYLTGRAIGSHCDSHYHHLLIMGLSASDRRIRYFLEFAMQLLPELKVFWLCYTPDDLERVREFADHSGSTAINYLRDSDLGVFLQQGYQCIAHSLPPNGVIFPSVSRLPMPPLPAFSHVPTYAETKHIAAVDARVLEVQHRRFSGNRLVVVLSSTHVFGVTTVASIVFQSLRDKGQTCLWLDLNDINSTDDLFERLLDAVWYACGVEEGMSVYLENDPRRRAQEISQAIIATGRHWVLFLNARETPGSNYQPKQSGRYPNGWLDFDKPSVASRISEADTYDSTACSDRFVDLVYELCGDACPNLTIVLLCRHPCFDGQDAPLIASLQRRARVRHSGFHPETWITFEPSALSADLATANAVKNAIEWAKSEADRHTFLHFMVLMQRTRFISTFWHHNASGGDSLRSPNQYEEWLHDLEQLNVVRRKAGGFIWLFTATRDELRLLYKCLHLGPSKVLGVGSDPLRQLDVLMSAVSPASLRSPALLHRIIAEWNQKVYLASKQPGAVFEALHHACEAAQWELDLGTSALTVESHSIREHFTWAYRLLKNADHMIRTRGFSRSSCRHLGELVRKLDSIGAQLVSGSEKSKEQPLLSLIAQVKKQCIITMRGVAREVAENVTCFKRHRQLRRLVLGKSVIELPDDWGHDLPIRFFADCEVSVADALRKWTLGYEPGQSSTDPPKEIPRPHLWVKWWRWSGLISNAARSMGDAEAAYITALSGFVDRPVRRIIHRRSSTKPQMCRLLHIEQWLELVVNSVIATDHCTFFTVACNDVATVGDEKVVTAVREEVVAVLEQYALLLLQWEQVCSRMGKLNSDIAESARHCVAAAIKILNGSISETSGSRDSTIRASKVRIRLLSHNAVVEAIERKPDCRSRAMRLLAEADSELDKFDPRREKSSWAILCLHRAEIFIRLALSTRTGQGESSFRDYLQQLIKTALHLDKPALLGIDAIPVGTLRKLRADIRDAVLSLDQAERGLLRRRKNVWWTTWMFQRRLRLIELELWLSLQTPEEPIPYLGLEAAPRLTDTLADELLRDTCRMVRFDSYRLATVVESYAHCALALHSRLEVDDRAERLPLRERQMRWYLQDSAQQLERVKQERSTNVSQQSERPRREGRPDVKRPRVRQPSKLIVDYVDDVLNTAKLVLLRIANEHH